MHVTHRLALLLSLDHFFSCESLLIRNIPIPWAWGREGGEEEEGKVGGGQGEDEVIRVEENKNRR